MNSYILAIIFLNMKMKSIIKGFTLIELLVVITIIGILATWAVTIYTAQIQKARDTTRINDVKALQSSIEQVYQDASTYPQSNEFGSGWVTNVKNYMEKVPSDPKSKQACSWNTPCDYLYIVADDANSIALWVYELSTWFESDWNIRTKAKTNGNDPKRFEVWLTVNTLVTSNSWSIKSVWCKKIWGWAPSKIDLIKIGKEC